MSLNFRDYENALKYGAKIGTSDIDGSLTTANIANATIKGSNIAVATIGGTNIATATIAGSNIAAATIAGSNLTLGNTYSVIAIPTKGPTAAYLFGTTTAPISGSITAIWTVTSEAGTNSGGTYTLWATTIGTMAQITASSSIGAFQGTGVVAVGSSSIIAGDTVYVKTSLDGTVTFFASFRSAN